MNHTTTEIEVVEATIADINDAQIRELNDLQLCLAGGGIGDCVAG